MKGRNRKTTYVLTALICALAVLTGCTPVETAESKYYVALITKSTTSAFWQSVHAGANAAAAEYNLDITFEGPEMEEDFKTQNQMIDAAVENGAEVIVFSAVDFNSNADAINRAAEAGVGIVVIDSDVNSSQVSSRIGTDNYAAGRMAARAVLESGEEAMHVGIVNYDVNSANGQQREEGFREAIENHPQVKDITTINVVSTTEDARIGTEELLKAHPEINVIATFNEWTSLGVGWAVRGMELADETMVVAFDSNVVSVGMLESGEVDALIVQNPYAMGYLGVETAYQLIRGQKVTPERDTSTTLINRDNMFEESSQRILFAFD